MNSSLSRHMPALPKAGLDTHQIITRAQASSGLFSANDIKAVLSDALLSFSPLATLVGAESARALADRVTNIKQSFVASVAPVGALGMMATVAKGSNLTGIKEMLGVGGQDIKDAARVLGCAAVAGDVIPRMDEKGGMTSNGTGHGLEQAACAIVRQRWQTGSRALPDRQLNLESLRRVPATFVAGTMSGRLMWEVQSHEKAMEMIRKVQEALSSPSFSERDVFNKMNDLDGGHGTIELHWPGPAMPLETNPSIIYLYGCSFVASFVSVAFFTGSHILLWQSPISSALLVGGQLLLILGHVAAQHAIKSQRETLEVRIPMRETTHWSMIDNTRFASAVARRPFPSHSSTLTLGQYHRFGSKYIATWHALPVLSALILGFIAFYVGGKSSDVKTVVIYIVLFILANVTKGPVVLYANQPHLTRLNNFGNQDIVSQTDCEDSDSFEAVPPADHQKIELSPMPTEPFRIYSKFFIRDRHATDAFYFSSKDEWILAAHVIEKAVKSIHLDGIEHADDLDCFMQIPLYQWNDTEKFHGLLLLAIDQIWPEHLFWSVGMEVVSTLMGNFGSLTLCSQDRRAANTSFLAAFVFTCVRMLLSEYVYCGNVLLPCKLRGVRSLMRAIETTTSSSKEPSDATPEFLGLLNCAAETAKRCKGVNLKSKKMLTYEDIRFSRLMGDDVPPILAKLKKIERCAAHLHQVEHLVDSRQPRLAQLQGGLRELRNMLTQLISLRLGASVLQEQIAQLQDKLQLIEDMRKADQIRRREEMLWDEGKEELKAELREMAEVESSQRWGHWHTQEVLRSRQRRRRAELQQSLSREEAAEQELQWEVHCLMVQLGAALQEQNDSLREQLRLELRKERVSISTNGRQQELEEEISRTKQNMVIVQQELIHDMNLDDPEEYMLQLHKLRFHQFFLELELHEIAFELRGESINPTSGSRSHLYEGNWLDDALHSTA